MTKRTVVGAIIVDNLSCPTRVLAAHRIEAPAGWEFPGGKCEPGESPVEALRRELREELGVDQVDVGEEFCSQIGVWPINDRLEMRLWWAQLGQTPGPLADHDELRWIDAPDLLDVDWLDADVAPAMALRNQMLLRDKPRYAATSTVREATLRPLRADDVDGLAQIWADVELTRNLGHLALSRPQAELYVRGRLAEAERGELIPLVLERDGEILAEARITLSPAWSVNGATGQWHASVGDSVRTDLQGQGWGTALMAEVLRICFDELGVRLVRALVFDRARASGAVLAKLGMRCCGQQRQCFQDVDGTWRDDDIYSITREDWLTFAPSSST